jgi:predicted GIY-YIG superfamily endonuclease
MRGDKACGRCGVYLITCLVNGKRYVGSSNNVGARVSQHFGKACTKRYSETNPFYGDIARYGREGFATEVLELCDPESKIERERWWYHQLSPEYNLIEPCEQPFKDPVVQARSRAAQSSERHALTRLASHRTERCRELCRKSQERRMRPCEAVSEGVTVRRFESMTEAARWVCSQRETSTITAINHIRRVLDGGCERAYGYEWKEAMPCG